MLKILVTGAVYMVCLFILVLVDHAPAALAVPPALRPQGQTGDEEAEEGQEGRP